MSDSESEAGDGRDGPEKTLASPDDLIPLVACCCFIEACYTDWPECCGFRVKFEGCCFSCQQMCCKPACSFCGEINPELRKDPDTRCVFLEGKSLCVKPDHCLIANCQCFCCDNRCALPPGSLDSDVPCVVALWGITCCMNGKCKLGACAKLGMLKTQIQAGAPSETEVDLTPRVDSGVTKRQFMQRQ